MVYRIMWAPPGHASHQRYMVAAYRTPDLPSSWSVGVKNTDGSNLFATLEEARRGIPAGARQLPFEPENQFLELWEAPGPGD
jgi:hypothetical protein